MLRLLLLIAATWLVVKLVLYLRKPARKPAPRLPSSGPSPHEVLGVDPGASREQIRRAYQEKIRQYHPDRVATLGPELREIAERRSKEINAAYRELGGGD